MDKIVKEDVSVGSGIISVFPRMNQKMERVFAEFIDNSTQSFKDHADELVKVNKNSVCKIIITWNNDEITISDNAFGMSHDDFKHALKLNNPRLNYSENSRSQYGMGLKTAASYLGEWYSIETTMLGSNEKYFSIIDIEDWKKNNPTEIENRISVSLENEHYTKIVIKKLFKPLTDSIDKSLRKKLALIYSEDISNGDLEIVFNGRPIIGIDPELRINKDTGSEYLNNFQDSFEFKGEKYEYYGWIGILKTASTSDAGFTLNQFGRGIKLNYRPQEIFGKPNSFQYQRVIGNICFDDKKWKISFNKDEFIWDDGLQEAFLNSLKNNKEVKYIKETAGNLRKEKDEIKPVVKQEDAKKSINKLTEKYSSLKTITKTNIAEPENNQPVVAIIPDDNIEANIVEISFEGIDYSFDIQVKNDSSEDNWLSIQKKDENSNSYYVIINGMTKYFSNYKNKECRDLIIDFAVSLALTQLSCARRGLDFDKSGIVIKQLNEILKNTN